MNSKISAILLSGTALAMYKGKHESIVPVNDNQKTEQSKIQRYASYASSGLKNVKGYASNAKDYVGGYIPNSVKDIGKNVYGKLQNLNEENEYSKNANSPQEIRKNNEAADAVDGFRKALVNFVTKVKALKGEAKCDPAALKQLNGKLMEEVAKLPGIIAEIEEKMPPALKKVLKKSQRIAEKFTIELNGKTPTEEDFKRLMKALNIDEIEKALEEAKNAEETPEQKEKMLTYKEAVKELANVKTEEEFLPAALKAVAKLGTDDVADLTSKIVEATNWVGPIGNAIACAQEAADTEQKQPTKSKKQRKAPAKTSENKDESA